MLGALLLILASVVAAAAVADRALAFVMVRNVGNRIATATHAASPPVVRIAGAPLLTQVLTGRYRYIEVTIAAFTVGGLDFTGLTARLRRVRAPLSRLWAGGGLLAGEFTATATIPMSALDDRLPPGLVLRHCGGELVVVSSLLPMPVSGVLHVTADTHRISLTPMVLGIPSLVGFSIGLPAMPRQLGIDSVLACGDGVRVSVSGDNVVLAER